MPKTIDWQQHLWTSKWWVVGFWYLCKQEEMKQKILHFLIYRENAVTGCYSSLMPFVAGINSWNILRINQMTCFALQQAFDPIARNKC